MHNRSLKARLLLALALLWAPVPVLADDWPDVTDDPVPAVMPEPAEPPAAEEVTAVPDPFVPPAAGPAAPPFVAGQVLTAAQLAAALAAPTIQGGSINAAPVGASLPNTGRFTSLQAEGNLLQTAGTATFGGASVFQVGDNTAIKRVILNSYMAPSTGKLDPVLLSQGNAFGTITNNASVATIRAFNVNGDSINAQGAQGGGLTANYFGHTISAGAVGGRTTLFTYLYHSGATTLGTGNQFYVSVGGFATSVASAGGTTGLRKGNLFGSNFGAFLKAGAGLYWHQVVGQELNVAVSTGAGVVDKIGLQIVQAGYDEVAATGTDAGMVFAANTTGGQAIGWKQAITFGANHGGWPLNPAGTLIGTGEQNKALTARYPMVTANGIDFASIPVKFTGRALATPGFSVDGSGQVTVGSNVIGWSSTGLTIGAAGKVGALSSINAAGINYRVGDILRDFSEGVWEVASVNGTGGITGLTMVKAPTDTDTSTPGNPRGLGGGMGTGASINMTWSTADQVRITGHLRLAVSTVAAAGTTQGTATVIPPGVSAVTVTSSGGSASGVKLPPGVVGMQMTVQSATSNGNAISIFPASGEAISAPGPAGVTNSPITISFATGSMTFTCFATGVWSLTGIFG